MFFHRCGVHSSRPNIQLCMHSRLSSYKCHITLALMQDPDISRDICDDDNDPLPVYVFESHGTKVAGQIISGKNNTHCGTGVAYNALFGSK